MADFSSAKIETKWKLNYAGIEGFPTQTEKAKEVVKKKKKNAPWNHSKIWSAQVITKWQWDIIYF